MSRRTFSGSLSCGNPSVDKSSRMILAPIKNRALQGAVRRAALPEEDVFHRSRDVRRALQFGYPRLLISEASELETVLTSLGPRSRLIPALAIGPRDVLHPGARGRGQGLAISPMDDSALRLRRLIRETSLKPDWVEDTLDDLTRIIGRELPGELKGFSRRVMESPVRYSSLGAVGDVFGLSAGALKARFRRRDLPSPARYLRWFRLLSAGRVLADPEVTTLTAAFRMGFASDGNFCRWVRDASGMNPSALREWDGRMLLLIRLAESCLSATALAGWESFGGLFLRRVA